MAYTDYEVRRRHCNAARARGFCRRTFCRPCMHACPFTVMGGEAATGGAVGAGPMRNLSQGEA